MKSYEIKENKHFKGGEGSKQTIRFVKSVSFKEGSALAEDGTVFYVTTDERGVPTEELMEERVSLKSFARWATEEVVVKKIVKPATEYLKVLFTEKEINDLARELAIFNRELNTQKENKKAVMSSISAEIEATESKIKAASTKITDGGEYRNVRAEWTFDEPKPGWKTMRRLDTNEIVKTAVMSENDLQLTLTEENKPKEEPKKEPVETAAEEPEGSGQNPAKQGSKKKKKENEDPSWGGDEQ